MNDSRHIATTARRARSSTCDRNGATERGPARPTSAIRPTFGSGWTAGDEQRPPLRAATSRIAGRPTNRVTLTVGVALRLPAAVLHAKRKPRVRPLTAVFPPSTHAGRSSAHAQQRRAARRRQRRPDGRRQDRWSRRSTAATTSTSPTASRRPIRAAPNYKDYKFNDLNGNRLYDGPPELGTLRQLDRRHDDDGRSEHQDAVHRRDRRVATIGSSGASRRSASPTSGRWSTTTTRRSTSGAHRPVHGADDGERQPAGRGQRRHRAADVHGVRHPERAEGRRAQRDHDHPGRGRRPVELRHDGVRVQQAVRPGLFLDAAIDYAHDELADDGGQHEPADAADPIAAGTSRTPIPTVPNRQKITNWRPPLEPLRLQVRHRRRR